MEKTGIIQQSWLSLWDSINDGGRENLSDIQRDECQKVFFAGFADCLSTVCTVCDDRSMAESITVFDKLSEEIKQFVTSCGRT